MSDAAALPPSLDYTITSVDYAALPAAMLDIAKQHMRVDFAEDDDIIQRYLASAIAHVEHVSGWRIFTTALDWFPVTDTTAYAYTTPLSPVSAFTVVSTVPPGDDISAEFYLITSTPVTPTWLARKDKTPFPSDIAITLTAGYADPDLMPPNVSDVILRIAATLYENRESVTNPAFYQIPFWMNDLMVGLWIPRV